MDTSNTQSQSSEKQSKASTPSIQSLHRKSDPTWEHCSEKIELGPDGKSKKIYTCLYCSSTYKSGGIHEMKHHLVGIKGQVASCKRLPSDVRIKMLDFLKQASQEKKEAKQARDYSFGYDPCDIELEEIQEKEVEINVSKGTNIVQDKGKRKASVGIDTYFAPRTTPGAQTSLKSVSAGKDVKRADMAMARWFFDACTPFNALNSLYFLPALDATLAIGPRYKGPSYNAMRVNLLRDCKKECSLLIETYRTKWAINACTIMADGWRDQRDRALTNFLVYCSVGISFAKSADASDVVKDAKTLCNLLSEIVEWVGPQNAVHFVMDNASNYVAARRLLHKRYEHICTGLLVMFIA